MSAKRREWWIDQREHSAMYKPSGRCTAWRVMPIDTYKYRTFVHVREVLPDEVCITREEYLNAVKRAWKLGNHGVVSMSEAIEHSLFGPLTDKSGDEK